MQEPFRALIIDGRGTIGTPVCRSLRRQGCRVDVFASEGSPIFRSRFCDRRFLAPPLLQREKTFNALRTIAQMVRYDEIHLGNEAVLELLQPLIGDDSWKGLLLPERSIVQLLLSKNSTLEFLSAAGISIPRTIIPASEQQL